MSSSPPGFNQPRPKTAQQPQPQPMPMHVQQQPYMVQHPQPQMMMPAFHQPQPEPAVRSLQPAVSARAAEKLATPLWVIAICHVIILLCLGYWMVRVTYLEMQMRNAVQEMDRQMQSGS